MSEYFYAILCIYMQYYVYTCNSMYIYVTFSISCIALCILEWQICWNVPIRAALHLAQCNPASERTSGKFETLKHLFPQKKLQTQYLKLNFRNKRCYTNDRWFHNKLGASWAFGFKERNIFLKFQCSKFWLITY